MRNPIQVWRFEDAPEEYKKLSPHGGDEDWLILVPPGYENDCIGWLEESTSSRIGCDISVHPLENGSVVHIGAH